MAIISKYDTGWTIDELAIEIYAVQHRGRWKNARGQEVGLGYYQHVRNFISMVWPDLYKWHEWGELLLREFCKHNLVGILGPASSGKTNTAAVWALVNYFCWPDCTTVLCSSTDRESLDLRIWGEIKKYFGHAKELWPQLPGFMGESRQTIITDDKSDLGREFRNGLMGVPCKVGGAWVGLGRYVGIKNERMFLIADEAQFMASGFKDAIPNLSKNPFFWACAMGNPKDPTDPLGEICEPDPSEGGWDGIDTSHKTKTWKTRMGGICVQLVGTDSPNFKVPEDKPVPFHFLITRQHIAKDKAYYGEDSMQYQMMDLGMMPKGGMARRVISRQLCIKHQALEEVVWSDTELTKVAGLDASYSGVGGDRCVLIFGQFGRSREGKLILANKGQPVIVPNDGKGEKTPEDQIASFVRQACEAEGVTPDHFGFDSTGRGTLALAFSRLWSPNVHAIEFGGGATDRRLRQGSERTCREAYSKMVTELWYFIREIIEHDQLRQLPEEVLAEGQMREFTVLQNGRIEVEPKHLTKERMGKSPDLFDAEVTMAEVARRNGFVIVGVSAEPARSYRWMEDWKKSYRKLLNQGQLKAA